MYGFVGAFISAVAEAKRRATSSFNALLRCLRTTCDELEGQPRSADNSSLLLWYIV
jgi:hypothetical protein